MFDIDTYTALHMEEQGYKKWEREQKTRILHITDYKRKQAEWNKLFPIMTLDDEYLSGNVF